MKERLVWAEINVNNFIYNLQSVKKLVNPTTRVMAVVKANAYGHGAVALAKAAIDNDASYLGVVCLYEARQLREARITAPILILNYIDEESLEACVDLDLTLNIMDTHLLSKLDEIAKRKHKIVPIHVKIDTGMHRLGLLPLEAVGFIETVQQYKNIRLEGVFTHFATSDEEDLTFTRTQLSVFTQTLDTIKQKGIQIPIVHAANSAATLRLPESHFDMVRPGVILYGMPPSGDVDLPFAAKPVLALKTRIVQIRDIEIGESVGYGRTFVANEKTRVAAIPVGYADGFRRAPSNWGKVLIQGKFAPIVGRVSMDQSSIDISHIPDVSIGDEVVLIGSQQKETISCEDVAKQLGTINYEVTSALATRVSRIIVT